MKKVLFFIAAIACMVACSSDDNNNISNIEADMVNIHVIGRDVKSMVTDAGKSLTVEPGMKVAEAMARPDTTYRAMLWYIQEPQQVCQIYQSITAVQLVPKDDISKAITTKQDPFYVSTAWLTKNMDYLNIGFVTMTGASTAVQPQKFDAVVENMQVIDGKKSLRVILMHDQNSHPQTYSQEGYITIPLKDLTKGDNITIKFVSYDGVVEKTFTLK